MSRITRVHKSLYEWSKEIANQKKINMVEAQRIIVEDHKNYQAKLQEIKNRESEQATMQINLDMSLGQKKLKRFRI